MRRLVRWLREELRWVWGASQIAYSNADVDEKTGEIRRKP
jgi:hypothetical protein